MRFFTYPKDPLPPMEGYIMLTVEAPPLTLEDKNKGLFFIDSTWRLAEKMERFADSQQIFEKRSLPYNIRTAYPRKQTGCTDAERGLASGLGISSIPTLMAFRDGILVFRQPGALPARELDKVIDLVRDLDMDGIRARVAQSTATA